MYTAMSQSHKKYENNEKKLNKHNCEPIGKQICTMYITSFLIPHKSSKARVWRKAFFLPPAEGCSPEEGWRSGRVDDRRRDGATP